MRITTRDRPRQGLTAPLTLRRQLIFGILGIAIGGVMGYGIGTAGPVPRSFTDRGVLVWTGGLGLVVGLISGLSGGRGLGQRSIRSARMRVDDSDDAAF